MKILFYIGTITSTGGAERVLTNLANEFSKIKNYEVLFAENFYSDKGYPINKNILRFGFEKIESKKNFLIKNLKRVYLLRKLVRHEQPNVLITFMNENNCRAIVATLGLKTRVVISVRNDPNYECGRGLKGLISKLLYRFADGIVFQTEDAKHWFPESIQKKSRIILNQVDKSFYNVEYEETRKDIVTTGRFALQKNHKMLIKAFAKIADSIEDNLIIFGDGDLREDYEQLITSYNLQSRILLPGAVNDVPSAIKSAKLFVMSSNYEGLPNSLMEAMALGIPCISTDCPCGGPKMLIQNGENGLLTPVGNADVLALNMKRVLLDKELAKKMGYNAAKTAKLFYPSVVFEEWEKYIEKIRL